MQTKKIIHYWNIVFVGLACAALGAAACQGEDDFALDETKGQSQTRPPDPNSFWVLTGGPKGAYFNTFCQPVVQSLSADYFDYQCYNTQGTAENYQFVSQAPKWVGMGQLDIVAQQMQQAQGVAPVTMVRPAAFEGDPNPDGSGTKI